VLAKPFPELFEQPVPVPYFLLAHFFEHVGRRRIAFPQRIRKLAINPPVFFLVLNRQRQNFAFRQFFKSFLHPAPSFASFRTNLMQENRTFPPSASRNAKFRDFRNIHAPSPQKYQSPLVLP